MDKTTDSSRLLRVIALEIGIMEELKSNSEFIKWPFRYFISGYVQCPGSKLKNAKLQQLTKENLCLWEQVIIVIRPSRMFSLYYCFPSKLDGCYKSEKCCQMPESYGFGLLSLKVGRAEIQDFFFFLTKGALISWCFCLSNLFPRDFSILLMKMLQIILSITERCAMNKQKNRTFTSRKKNHTCLLLLQ